MTSHPGSAGRAGTPPLRRVVGAASMGIALVLMGIAIADFLHFENSSGGPTKFWMFLLALPFFVVGGIALQDLLGADPVSVATGPPCATCGAPTAAEATRCDSCGAPLG